MKTYVPRARWQRGIGFIPRTMPDPNTRIGRRRLARKAPIYVNVYRVERCYGGPEEGGWWYTSGEPEVCIRVPNMASAIKVEKHLVEKYPEGTGRDSMYSAAYRGGDCRVYIEDCPAIYFPAVRPRYE